MESNFNDTHPELLEGEQVFGNHRLMMSMRGVLENCLPDIPLANKRFGETAYMATGEVVPGYVPIIFKKV